jgi:hypothetical protein
MADQTVETPVDAVQESDTEPTATPAPNSTTPTPETRPKLTKEEQYHVLKGRLKRLEKDLGIQEQAPQNSTPDASADLLQKTFLRSAGITADDEVALAQETAKKWGMPIDKLVDDEDFKQKLETLRTKKANELATSGIEGGGATKGVNEDPAYWIAKGTPPTREQVPNRKARAAIARAMVAASKNNGKKFYND